MAVLAFDAVHHPADRMRRRMAILGMKRVIIESPFAGDINLHMGYLRRCLRDSLMRGEAPFASHRIYTFCLNDIDPVEREIGMQAGFAWAERADLTAVYTDFDISEGMKEGIEHAIRCGRPVEYRTIRGARSDRHSETC